LKTLPALNLFLSQCLSEKAEKAMVQNYPLPEWRQKSPSQSPDHYTADPVPNSKKREKEMAILEGR
jgi:hypothetical protein